MFLKWEVKPTSLPFFSDFDHKFDGSITTKNVFSVIRDFDSVKFGNSTLLTQNFYGTMRMLNRAFHARQTSTLRCQEVAEIHLKIIWFQLV